MQIFDPNVIRNHPAAVALRRANERRAARQAQPVQTPAPAALTPCLGERDFLYSDITGAWLAKYPNYSITDTLVARYGVIHLWQLSTPQLRELLAAINA